MIIGKSLESVELKVEKLNLDSSILLLKFFDVNDRDSAEKYRDYELYIHRSELVKEDDDLFLVDLIGCDLFFDKNFKIRLTSKATGRKIDLNVNFNHIHVPWNIDNPNKENKVVGDDD